MISNLLADFIIANIIRRNIAKSLIDFLQDVMEACGIPRKVGDVPVRVGFIIELLNFNRCMCTCMAVENRWLWYGTLLDATIWLWQAPAGLGKGSNGNFSYVSSFRFICPTRWGGQKKRKNTRKAGRVTEVSVGPSSQSCWRDLMIINLIINYTVTGSISFDWIFFLCVLWFLLHHNRKAHFCNLWVDLDLENKPRLGHIDYATAYWKAHHQIYALKVQRLFRVRISDQPPIENLVYIHARCFNSIQFVLFNVYLHVLHTYLSATMGFDSNVRMFELSLGW